MALPKTLWLPPTALDKADDEHYRALVIEKAHFLAPENESGSKRPIAEGMASVGINTDVTGIVYAPAPGDTRPGFVTVRFVAQVTEGAQANSKKVWANHPMGRLEAVALAAPAGGLTATAATAPQAAGAKRGSDTQAAALHRPATSARITVNPPTPAPLAAASARQKRRHSGAASRDQRNGSTASQPKRRRAPVVPATQSTERFLTPVATTAVPPNPAQDQPAPLPPPEP